ncbi:SAVED domain-containing protein [Pedobacter sp.]
MAKKKNVKISIDGYQVETRPDVVLKEKIRLWVQSGGRCAICNKYLLDLEYNVSIGEMAHIAGWKKDEASPRGLSDVPMDIRNTADNLILLCAEHHKIVDTKELIEEFSLQRLMKHKADHEKRILHLTGLQMDAQSVVVRMLGGIRGVPVEVSNENVRNVVFNSENKFAMFLDSYDRQGIEIDLTSLADPEEQWESYWLAGKGIIDKSLLRLRDGISMGNVRHLSVFAFSRIPLLAYLGYELGDKVPTSFYQKHRDQEETWLWSSTEKIEMFEVLNLQEDPSCEVLLLLCISGTIDLASLPSEMVQGRNIYVIRPIDTVPHRNIFRNKQSYDQFCNTYHEFLSRLEVNHSACRTIHLLPAIPITAAIACGRGIMRDAHPELAIYDRCRDSYRHALTINAK